MSEIEKLTDEYREHLADVAPGAPEIIDAQAERIAELDAAHAKARHRISTLEAQLLASDTVSKTEYAAMVKQRDTMREELKAARHLLNDALPWLKARAHDGTGLEEWLDGQEFYDLMQAYRHMPIAKQAEVTRQYEAIKARLREFSFALEDQADTLPVLGSLIRTTEALPPFRA